MRHQEEEEEGEHDDEEEEERTQLSKKQKTNNESEEGEVSSSEDEDSSDTEEEEEETADANQNVKMLVKRTEKVKPVPGKTPKELLKGLHDSEFMEKALNDFNALDGGEQNKSLFGLLFQNQVTHQSFFFCLCFLLFITNYMFLSTRFSWHILLERSIRWPCPTPEVPPLRFV